MKARIKEGFPNQRLVVVPRNALERCRSLSVIRNLYVTDIGEYPSAPNHYVSRESGVEEAIMICCLSGAGRLRLGDVKHTITRGTILFISPGVPHAYWADEHDPWSIFWIHFGGSLVDEILESYSITPSSPLLYVGDLHKVKASFEDVYACLNYHYSDTGLFAMSSELFRLFGSIKVVQGNVEPKRRSAEQKVLGTIAFMQSHLNMALTIRQLAKHSGQSDSYYSHVFKEKTGQSPLNYFIQLKISKACELLDQTSLSVLEISNQLGYSDPYYFSRIFKKVQGVSPRAYRRFLKG
jgi:AraC-like DNA-binding protein